MNTQTVAELLLGHVSTLIGLGLGLLLVARIMRQQSRPAVSIAWLLSIFLIPYIGVPAYLLFGGRKLHRTAGRKPYLYDGRPERTESDPGNHIEKVLSTAGMPPARRENLVEVIADGTEAYRRLLKIDRRG